MAKSRLKTLKRLADFSEINFPTSRIFCLWDFFATDTCFTLNKSDVILESQNGCDIMANISRNIKRLRKENNLTQDALAEKLFVTRQTVSYWETGRNQPTLDMLGDLATALNCNPLDIIGTKKQKMTPTQDFILFQLMQIVKNKLLYIIL